MAEMYSISDYVREEAEDPPEPFKTPEALLNDRNPLDKLEERIDAKSMIIRNNWGLYFLSEEYWNYHEPFSDGQMEEGEVLEYMASQTGGDNNFYGSGLTQAMYTADFKEGEEPSFSMVYSLQVIESDLDEDAPKSIESDEKEEVPIHIADLEFEPDYQIELAINEVIKKRMAA